MNERERGKFLQTVPVALPKERIDDPRVGALLGKSLLPDEAPLAAVIGFPVDEGVKRNGGRTGSSGAPLLIRQALFKLTPGGGPDAGIQDIAGKIVDWGDIKLTGSLEGDQAALASIVAAALKQKTIPIILGGGHETAYGHFLGYVEANTPVNILNIDAHPDVRPLESGKGHSGSPFRQALEHSSGLCERYLVAGLQPHACAAEHLQYLRSKRAEFLYRKALSVSQIDSLFSKLKSASMLTFDIDAVDESHAPGVSAPCMGGLSADHWLHIAALAGAHPEVQSIDLVEFNPQYDIDSRTARLAALTIWHFLLGLAERLKNAKRPRLGFGG